MLSSVSRALATQGCFWCRAEGPRFARVCVNERSSAGARRVYQRGTGARGWKRVRRAGRAGDWGGSHLRAAQTPGDCASVGASSHFFVFPLKKRGAEGARPVFPAQKKDGTIHALYTSVPLRVVHQAAEWNLVHDHQRVPAIHVPRFPRHPREGSEGTRQLNDSHTRETRALAPMGRVWSTGTREGRAHLCRLARSDAPRRSITRRCPHHAATEPRCVRPAEILPVSSDMAH